jgi:glycosyltransferase involved in cell wall biosynthesis
MKVAFCLNHGLEWTGGIHYLANLFSALAELPGRPVEPILFTSLQTDDRVLRPLIPFLSTPPIKSELWTKGTSSRRTRIASSLILQRDYLAERAFRDAGIDLVFQNSAWYGFRFPLPSLTWMADFQHRHLPEMFSYPAYWKRELSYQALTLSADKIVVSSQDAKTDCERFYPVSKGKIEALPFAVRVNPDLWSQQPEHVRKKYNLPDKFIFLPNQFWKHKNHLAVIEALLILKSQGDKIVIVASGSMQDYRNPSYPRLILSRVDEYGLKEDFRVLGLIPYEDISPLMRTAIAVMNPSFFEGWSTIVEEAKSIGAPLLLSNLRVHLEQSPKQCLYFDPHDPRSIADAVSVAWTKWKPGPHEELEKYAKIHGQIWRSTYAREFVRISQETTEKKTRKF